VFPFANIPTQVCVICWILTNLLVFSQDCKKQKDAGCSQGIRSARRRQSTVLDICASNREQISPFFGKFSPVHLTFDKSDSRRLEDIKTGEIFAYQVADQNAGCSNIVIPCLQVRLSLVSLKTRRDEWSPVEQLQERNHTTSTQAWWKKIRSSWFTEDVGHPFILLVPRKISYAQLFEIVWQRIQHGVSLRDTQLALSLDNLSHIFELKLKTSHLSEVCLHEDSKIILKDNQVRKCMSLTNSSSAINNWMGFVHFQKGV
jgi:hypothetical protein